LLNQLASDLFTTLSGRNFYHIVCGKKYPSLLGIEGQKKHEKFAILTRKPQTHARILIYQTWPIASKKKKKQKKAKM